MHSARKAGTRVTRDTTGVAAAFCIRGIWQRCWEPAPQSTYDLHSNRGTVHVGFDRRQILELKLPGARKTHSQQTVMFKSLVHEGLSLMHLITLSTVLELATPGWSPGPLPARTRLDDYQETIEVLYSFNRDKAANHAHTNKLC